MSLGEELIKQLNINTKLQLTTIAVMSFSLFVVISLFTVFLNIENIFSSWSKNLEMTLYLSEEISEEVIEKNISSIKSHGEVESVKFVSKDDFKESFDKKMYQVLPKLKILENIENPFSNGIEVRFFSEAGINNVDIFMSRMEKLFSGLNGVYDISYGKAWLNEYMQIVKAMKSGTSVIMLVLFLSLVFIIANAIKTLISSRKEEIEIMEIIGASSASIQKPYIINAIILGVLSFLIATLLSLILSGFVAKIFALHIQAMNIQIVYPSFGDFFMLLILTTMVCLLGAYLHLRRTTYLRYR